MQKIKNYIRWLFSSKKPDPELVKWLDEQFEEARQLLISEGQKNIKAKYKI